MGIQKQILTNMLEKFQELQFETKPDIRIYIKTIIQKEFKRSINKSNIIRRILFEAMLSDSETLEILKIIYYKKKD
jgi:hypothetical protein